MNYRLAYAIGLHPWEDLAEHPPLADTLLALVAREEAGREPPYGPALDLGTGSAVWAVQLARRGWRVTGVDLVEKALHRARERVDETDVEDADTEADALARLFKFDERFYRLRRNEAGAISTPTERRRESSCSTRCA